MIRVLLMWMLWLGVAAASPPGATDERAREWFVNGQALYQEGRYRDALVAFEAAYRMSSRPTILRSIAYCHEHLGELEQAIDVLYRFRGLAPEEKWIEIDRRISHLEIQLEKEQEQLVVVQPPPSRPVESEFPPKRTVYEPPKWRVGAGPVVLYSVAGAGAIVGAVFAVNAHRARAQIAELCSQADAIFCRAEAAQYINQDWLYSLIADTGFGFAGAGIAGGTVWMVLDNGKANPIHVGMSPSGIGLRGNF